MRAFLVLAAAVVGFIVGFILGKSIGVSRETVGRTPPPMTPISDPTDTTQRGAVLAYARSLTFAYDKPEASDPPQATPARPDNSKKDPYGPNGAYHGQFDQNLLDTAGDSGIVAPEIHIQRSQPSDLREGRIQLRVDIIPGRGRAAKDVFDSVGFYPGTSYVWVDRLGSNAEGDTARAVIVPTDPKLPIVVRKIHKYHTPAWNLAVARWTPATCWSCASEGWCH